MAFNFGKLNRGTVREGIDTNNMEFKPLKDFCGETVKCNGFFFTYGQYGKQVVVVGDEYLINMPQRAVKQFEYIENDFDAMDEILKGNVVIKDIEIIETKRGNTTKYKFA